MLTFSPSLSVLPSRALSIFPQAFFAEGFSPVIRLAILPACSPVVTFQLHLIPGGIALFHIGWRGLRTGELTLRFPKGHRLRPNSSSMM